MRLSPPGHVDLGWHTTFPHCPRCKKHNGERWETPYSTRPVFCAACGKAYEPAATASAVRAAERERDDLEQLLLPAEYAALRAEWERRRRDDPPTWLENLLSGKVDVAQELMNEAAAATRPTVWSRVRGWFNR